MSKNQLIRELEQEQMKTEIASFAIGDTISIHLRIIEGQKERIQIFTGTAIARKGGGLSESVTLHRIAYGVGMSRVFLLHSPLIAKIEVKRKGKVRRSKLYNLLGKYGKAARVKGAQEGRRSPGNIAKKKPTVAQTSQE